MTGTNALPPIDIALAFAPLGVRPAWTVLFGLDRRLAQVIAGAREPQLAAIRLKWWEEALEGLTHPGSVVEDPLLAQLADLVRRYDVNPASLSGLISGWAELLEPLPLSQDGLGRFAKVRGGLFGTAALIAAEAALPAAQVGAAWALHDLVRHMSDPATAERARAMARDIVTPRLPRRLSTLAILANWARMAGQGPVSSRRYALAAMRIALIGR